MAFGLSTIACHLSIILINWQLHVRRPHWRPQEKVPWFFLINLNTVRYWHPSCPSLIFLHAHTHALSLFFDTGPVTVDSLSLCSNTLTCEIPFGASNFFFLRNLQIEKFHSIRNSADPLASQPHYFTIIDLFICTKWNSVNTHWNVYIIVFAHSHRTHYITQLRKFQAHGSRKFNCRFQKGDIILYIPFVGLTMCICRWYCSIRFLSIWAFSILFLLHLFGIGFCLD